MTATPIIDWLKEGTRMPRFLKYAWRTLATASGAAMLMIAMPAAGNAQISQTPITICITARGFIGGDRRTLPLERTRPLMESARNCGRNGRRWASGSARRYRSAGCRWCSRSSRSGRSHRRCGTSRFDGTAWRDRPGRSGRRHRCARPDRVGRTNRSGGSGW